MVGYSNTVRLPFQIRKRPPALLEAFLQGSEAARPGRGIRSSIVSRARRVCAPLVSRRDPGTHHRSQTVQKHVVYVAITAYIEQLQHLDTETK
jgi:hypothetical protein